MYRIATTFHALIGLATLIAITAAIAAEPSAPLPSAPQTAEQLLARLKPQHPRLLLDAAGFEDLRRRVEKDATLQRWDQSLCRAAERILKAPLPQHVLPDGKRLLSTSRNVVQHSYTLALAYRLHHDRRFLERLWQELQTVAAFPDFNPSHFLDTAEMTHGLAIAYDWLYDSWSVPQRATIRRAIVELGLKPGLAVYQSKAKQGGGWHRGAYNWNQVCNGGLTAGALAVADEEPRLAGQIVEHALASIPLAMHSYAPDGAGAEGPGYWAYATSYNVLMLASLESALGSDFGLSQSEGFAQTALFPLYMTGPTGRCFNFADCHEFVGQDACLLWLGQRFHLPVATWLATQSGTLSAQGMLWYRQPGLDPAAAGLPLGKYWRKVEVVTLRGRWNDPQAVFVGMRAGSNLVNHNHLDLGSFVLDGLGQRWAADLGADDYNLPDYFGRKRYDYYRLRAEGHNTLVLNPDGSPDQDPKATARISRYDFQPRRAFAIADLTPAYAKHATRVQRGLALLDRRTVLVEDEVLADKADVWWFMHTPADIVLSDHGRTAALSQGKSKYVARILAPAPARFEVQPAVALPSSPNPHGQKDNQGVRKLAIHLMGVNDLRLAVFFVPVDGRAEAAPPAVQPLARW